MQNFITMLQTAEVVESSGFAIGFGSTFLHRDTLEHPLWAIFGSSMSGFFCAFLFTSFRRSLIMESN